MKSKRRNYSAQFKAKVALAAAKGDKTTAELSKQFQVHPTQITKWKKQLTDSLPEIFSLRRHQDIPITAKFGWIMIMPRLFQPFSQAFQDSLAWQ